jgi:Domain of unknown function (DUF4380)
MKIAWRFLFAALALSSLMFRAWERDAETSGPPPGAKVRVDLTKGDFVVSVVPSLGGRVVGLRAGNGLNLLAWDERNEQGPLPLPSLETPFAPWNGRIVWVGPQSAWWSHQDLSPERKAAKPPWPPDPFHEAARYEVVERTPTLVVMKGSVSPITGLEFTETVEIVGPRKARFVTVATNRRATSVAWDLWPNTRVRPEGWPYVRVAPGTVPRIDAPKGGRAAAYPHRIVDGFLALPPGVRPEAPAQQLHVKVFLQPASGEIAYFLGRQLLRLQAELVPPENLHPEQAFVELYRGAGADPGSDILELEMHGPYVRLGPGESMRFEQTAEVQDYDGTPNPERHVAFLKALPGAVESKAILR